jgi:ligand-binding SRPBCC domain-containing protein
MLHKDEQVVGGTSSGLLKKGDEVTWKAKHIFKKRIMKVRVTEMTMPEFFSDEQVVGDFVMMKHEHYFKAIENGTIMIDQFHYEAPYGAVGKFFDAIYLRSYMTSLLKHRNDAIKTLAESQQWKQFLET